MTECPACGYENVLGSNFCSSCGHDLQSEKSLEEVTATYEVITVEEEIPELSDLPEGSLGALVVYQGPKRGTRIALSTANITIGRDPSSDVFLDDVTVSRTHAKLERNGNEYQVTDLGSMNGTYVNKQLAESVILADRDELQVGRFKLVYFDLSAESEDKGE